MKNKKLLIANIAGIFLLLCTVMIFSNTAQAASKAQIKKWLTSKTWSNKVEDPVMEYNIFRSVENVNLNTVIGYKQDGVRHNFLDTYDDVK